MSSHTSCHHPFWTNRHKCATCGIKLHEAKQEEIRSLKAQLEVARHTLETITRLDPDGGAQEIMRARCLAQETLKKAALDKGE